MIQTYVEFIYPGIVVAERSSEKVTDRSKPKLPKGAIGYRFYERTEKTVDGELLEGPIKNYSGFFYVGQEFTAAEYLKHHTCSDIARQNILGNGYKRLVLFKTGQLFPLSEKDTVISE